MCGIAGVNRKDEDLVKKMIDLLMHRGPDMKGLYFDEKVSLSHSRLSILDLSEKGKQPMSNEDGTVYITYNGEIFNYQQLKNDLISCGHTFISDTDTEVIVHGYEQYGKDILNRLNGQFAFCIYDKNEETFFLARDRLGILPLYYYVNNGDFIFASQLQSILCSGIPKKINKTSLCKYLRFRAISAPDSIIENVFKLEPGHYIVYDLNKKGVKENKEFWAFDHNCKNDENNVEELKKKIKEGVRQSIAKRMIADVPVGAFLSGGIDSSIVVSEFAKMKKDLKTFSVRFTDASFDEGTYAQKISKGSGTQHYERFLKDEDILRIMPILAEKYDEPLADPSCLPTYFVSEFARKYVTVCISGDGADELLGGYNRYRYFYVAKKLNKMPFFVKCALKAILSFFTCFSRSYEIGKIIEILSLEKMEDLKLYERLVEKIGRDDLKVLLKGEDLITDSTCNIKIRTGLISLQLYDILHYLEGDILVKVDRAAMAVNLETRPPLLDHNFVQMCLNVEDDLKIKGNIGKWIFREAFKDIIPEKILKRRKKGFGIPLKAYLQGPLKGYVDKYVLNYNGHDMFDISYIKELNEDSSKNTERLFWTIMMFNMWYDRWILEKQVST